MPKYLAKILVPIEANDLDAVQRILMDYVRTGIKQECAIELLEHSEDPDEEPVDQEVKTFKQLMDSLSDQSTKQ